MDDILLYKDESLSKIFNDKKHLINEYSNLNIEGISVESQTKLGNNNLIYNDYNHPICYTDFMKKPSILINETLEYNKKRAAIVFPTTYIIDQNGNREIYSSIENKFESEDSAKVM